MPNKLRVKYRQVPLEEFKNLIKDGKGFDGSSVEGFARTEDPRGEAIIYIVGDGKNMPYRIHIRSPTYINLSLLHFLLRKAKFADIAAIRPARLKELNGTLIVGKFKLIVKLGPPRPLVQYILLNCQRPPFNITEVRRALAYAVPYDTILKVIFAGFYDYVPTLVTKGIEGYTEYNVVKYEFNLTKARQWDGRTL